jgi:hypothetical protein
LEGAEKGCEQQNVCLVRQGEQHMRKQTDLRRALNDLNAYPAGRGLWAYVACDEGHDVEYTLRSDDWRAYGAALRRDDYDAYSLWCAATEPTRREIKNNG